MAKKPGRKDTTVVTTAPTPVPRKGPAGTASLVLIHPPGPSLGRRFELGGQPATLGSLADVELSVDQVGVSRRHARLGRAADGWFVEDLGSTNGTFVNDARVDRHVLAEGDLLRVGVAILKFISGSDVESAYHEAIYKMAIHDALTGVSNRRFFLEFIDREVARSLRYQVPLSLVLFDIDHFKKINDEHGHLAGDEVLREIGRRLRPRMRKEDLLARYGGEEFACVLTGTERAGALVFARATLLIIGGVPFSIEGKELRITASLGVETMDGVASRTVEDLIRHADEKLYEAKRSGRNRVVG